MANTHSPAQLRDLITAAVSALDTYKDPDVGEVQSRLNELLKAAHIGDIGSDRLDSLEIYDGQLHIETSWSSRGCSNGSTYRLPISVIDSENPVAAAKIWGLEKRIKQAEADLAHAKHEVADSEKTLVDLRAALSKATGEQQ